MAPGHVPADHALAHAPQQQHQQHQSMYTDSAYGSIFSNPQYGDARSWSQGQPGQAALSQNASQQNQPWQQSAYGQPYAAAPNQPTYSAQNRDYANASPYQYAQSGVPAHGSSFTSASKVDPALGSIEPNSLRQQQQSPYQAHAHNAQVQTQPTTITPQALQQNLNGARPESSTYQIPKSTTELFAHRLAVPAAPSPVKNPDYEIPKAKKSGGFTVLDQVELCKATNSTALTKFISLGSDVFQLPSNRTALPVYTPRQSVKHLRKTGPDSRKPVVKRSPAKPVSERPTHVELSDSESYDETSDDGSDYSDEEGAEPSPLAATRPDEMHAAVRYDIIKATWFPRSSQPSSEKIKSSLRDMWEVINTIQKRWRADSKAVTEAEEQKKSVELPVLRNRVSGQRDLLQSALTAALEHAHPDVLYHVGQVKPFLYMCYLFLANRFKAQDYDGSLSSAIYEVLARCVGTLTTELLDETKVAKALNSMKKNASSKHKLLIQQIVDGAAAGSKKAKVNSPPNLGPVEDVKSAKRPAPVSTDRNSVQAPAAKKGKVEGPPAVGEKKTGQASVPSKPAASTVVKRPLDKPAPVPVKARGTQIVNKPSNLFASINAVSKKPTVSANPTVNAKPAAKAAVATAKEKKPTPAPVPASKPSFSFAETMAQLLKPKEEEKTAPLKTEKQIPNETPSERTKRLRKESRRHLRVTFRPDANLVDIRYFHHDPEEESGHDENFVRDAGDIGGEGHMFKQHKDMMDEEEDDEEEDEVYRAWRDPTPINFDCIDIGERTRNYEPYGGGQVQPSCPEKEANINHESTTLMVFYAHPIDIPSSPREPLELQSQAATSASVTHFGPPPELVVSRAPKTATPAPVPDFSNLEALIKQLAVPDAAQVAAQPAQPAQMSYAPVPAMHTPAPIPAPPVTHDLASILSALGQGQSPAAALAPTTASMPTAQAPAAANLDLQAIMAAIAGGGAHSAPAPPAWSMYSANMVPAPPADSNAAYMLSQQGQQEVHNAYSAQKRQRDDGQDGDMNKRGRFEKEKSFAGFGKRHKVLPCKFYHKGLCTKGDDCTYIHDPN